jgi:arylsulfatase A-like enzyme
LRRAILLLSVLATCSGACSRPVVGPSSTRIQLAVVSGTWPEPEETVVLSLPIPERLEEGGWFAIDNPTAEIALVPDPAHAPAGSPAAPAAPAATVRALRMLPAQKPFFVRIPVDLDAKDFDLVRIRYQSRGFTRVAALVGRATKRYTLGDFIERNALMEPVELDLDMSMLVEDDRHLAELHVVFELLTAEAQLFGVELIRRSASMRLPSPFEPAQHVAIGTGSRRAVGLLPGIELEGRLPEGVRGSLALEASLPPAIAASEEETLIVELFDGQRSLQSVSFPLDSRWSTHSIELPKGPQGNGLSFRVRTSSPLGALLGPARILAGPRPRGAPPPRTVVLITSDTHRADHLGCAPNGAGVKTPAIDRLAADGVCFTNATSVSSITNPSHSAIFTGKHVRDTGIVGNLVTLAERARTLAEEFRAAGWRTFASVSARHLMPWRSGFGQGFARFDAPGKVMARDASETLAQARAMLADAEHHDVFLWLHLFDAHAPYDPQGEWTELYYTGDPYSPELPELEEPVQASWNKRVRDASYLRALYKGEISYLDQNLQHFFDDVPRVRAGYVVFTADHGESLGENQLYWDHSAIYPSTLRVPLIIAGPGVPAGVTVDAHVSNRDVAKTILALVGLDRPGEDGALFPGRSLLDQRAVESAALDPWFVIGEGGLSAGVFFERWYLLLHLRGKVWGNPANPVAHSIELYDRERDPACADNVVAAHPKKARELRALLVHWLADLPEEGLLTGESPEDAGARADIAALGYTTDAPSQIESALIDPSCGCPECERYR